MPTLRHEQTRTTVIRWSALPVESAVAENGGGRDAHELAELECAAGRLAALFGNLFNSIGYEVLIKYACQKFKLVLAYKQNRLLIIFT